MPTTLLKIYSFFVIAVIVFSGVFVYTKRASTPFVSQNIPRKQLGDSSGIIIPPSEILPTVSTTTPSKIISPEKTISKATITTQTPHSSAIQLTEIDTREIDTRTETQKPNPCITPITYTLGTFDSRFGISKNYFLETISEEVTLWNNAVGKKLFEYNPQGSRGDLIINLVYDQRQQNTNNNKLLAAEIENAKNSATIIQKEYENLEIIFSERKDNYVQRVDNFNTRQKIYNDTVASWNEKGGAPRTEYDALNIEKEELQKESDALTNEHNTLREILADINTKILKHNEFIAFINERVNINNTTANIKFTEGNYSPSTNSVTIYQFTDDTKLKRVIAHELGHALGIDHNQNKESIMYSINSSTVTTLSDEDVVEIKNTCANY